MNVKRAPATQQLQPIKRFTSEVFHGSLLGCNGMFHACGRLYSLLTFVRPRRFSSFPLRHRPRMRPKRSRLSYRPKYFLPLPTWPGFLSIYVAIISVRIEAS